MEQYAKNNELLFFKVSAKSGEGIQVLFRCIAAKLYERNNSVQSQVMQGGDLKRGNYRQEKVSLNGAGYKGAQENDTKCAC